MPRTAASLMGEDARAKAVARPLRREICGVAVSPFTEADALAWLDQAWNGGPAVQLAYCNAHVVNVAAQNAAFRAALASMIVLPDGIGVDLAARVLHGAPFPANLNGTDFTPKLIRAASRPLVIGLYGGRPGVADKAAAALMAMDPRHHVEVLGHGFLDAAGQAAMLGRLRAHPVDLLLVALGNPGQELWMARHDGLGLAQVTAGVGALFDFLAGEVPRAPLWMRRWRVEWLYRLAQEPMRLWRRYILGNPAFLMRVAVARLRRAA